MLLLNSCINSNASEFFLSQKHVMSRRLLCQASSPMASPLTLAFNIFPFEVRELGMLDGVFKTRRFPTWRSSSCMPDLLQAWCKLTLPTRVSGTVRRVWNASAMSLGLRHLVLPTSPSITRLVTDRRPVHWQHQRLSATPQSLGPHY